MFNINGEDWGVKLVSPDHPKLLKSNEQHALGVCDDNVKMIYINEELSDRMIKKVLCHEVMHAAMFSYNVELSIEQEELLADLVATYGQEIIHITNKIFRRILENKKEEEL